MAYNTGIQLGASLLNLLDVEKIWTSIDADGKILLMHITECVKMKRRYALPAAVLRKKNPINAQFRKIHPRPQNFSAGSCVYVFWALT